MTKKLQRDKDKELAGLQFVGGDGSAAAKKQVINSDKVGRNDPCPCGSGKKYKKCHGADAPAPVGQDSSLSGLYRAGFSPRGASAPRATGPSGGYRSLTVRPASTACPSVRGGRVRSKTLNAGLQPRAG